jgi:hypothetical protein
MPDMDATRPRAGSASLGFQVSGKSALIGRLKSREAKVVAPASKQHWGELPSRVEDPEADILAFEERISARNRSHHRPARPSTHASDGAER